MYLTALAASHSPDGRAQARGRRHDEHDDALAQAPLQAVPAPVTAPHGVLKENRWLCLTALGASLLLSLWAVYLDPVINNDGILYVQAAEQFRAGEWAAGLSTYKWPFYSLVIAAAGAVTGAALDYAAHAVNAAFYVILVLGFVALTRALGAGRAVQWIALLVALAHPTLNEYRPFVIRDIGYWACYLWALAYFFSYLETRGRQTLAGWLGFSTLASLFRIEGIVLMTVLPACLAVAHGRGRHRAAAAVLVAAVTIAVMSAAPLWQYLSDLWRHLSEASPPRQSVFMHPAAHVIESWQLGVAELEARLEVLRREFAGLSSPVLAATVYTSTVLFMLLYELARSLGVVFAALVACAVYRSDGFPRRALQPWWGIAAAVQGLLVFQFLFSKLFLSERYAVALALTLLAIVPFCLQRLWRHWRHTRQHAPGRASWPAALLGVLLLIQTVEGLDIATGKRHIREAGLWLRGNAEPGSTLYSNDRILVYYSGLREARADATYTWTEAMQVLWTDTWQSHDYFVLVMDEARMRHEVLLLDRIDRQPVKRFSNGRGEAVLIFRSP